MARLVIIGIGILGIAALIRRNTRMGVILIAVALLLELFRYLTV
jgi:hypothetical protein